MLSLDDISSENASPVKKQSSTSVTLGKHSSFKLKPNVMKLNEKNSINIEGLDLNESDKRSNSANSLSDDD